jgi:hypothetical protein
MSKTTRDEARIKHNLARLHDARGEYNHLAWCAVNAKAAMYSALDDLKAAGGIEEAKQAMGADFK